MIALAVAPISAVEGVQKSTGATYPLLADPGHQVAEAYGVYNLLGDNLAAPSVFVIGEDGSIVWHYVGHKASDRPAIQRILEYVP